jgi:hypothetical protein
MGDCGFLINRSFFLVAAEATLPLRACFGAMGTTKSIVKVDFEVVFV